MWYKFSITQDDVIAVKCRDISEVMRDRVAKGYGFNAVQNAKLLEDDVILRNVWEWLAGTLPLPP